MIEHLKETGISEKQIVEMNFESYAFRKMNSDDFYEYVRQRVLPDQRMYLFFDEVQRIPAWEEVVNAFRIDFNCDLYLTALTLICCLRSMLHIYPVGV